MNVPRPLIEWLDAKVGGQRWAGVREARTVAHSWFRALGGRNMSACLSASIRPSAEFSLELEAVGVATEYVEGAKSAVLTVLLSQGVSPVLACTVKLFDFAPHAIDSSYASFYAVAKEATEQLLGVAPGLSSNIAW